MVKNVERENIWKMQGVKFQGSACFCENNNPSSMQQVYQCIECCHAPLTQVQASMTRELEKVLDCMVGYTMHCNNEAKESMDAGCEELQVNQQLGQLNEQVCT
ncbi:Protein FAM136A [Sciurus carolinensis]|uniref:Protein FAM136A n=1 Tax=Sciurus carolinensis TaxID=30640 RepID=A0AA41T358_SCICA|nr:Protein FAM136A [Sciurus carolinensis]